MARREFYVRGESYDHNLDKATWIGLTKSSVRKAIADYFACKLMGYPYIYIYEWVGNNAWVEVTTEILNARRNGRRSKTRTVASSS